MLFSLITAAGPSLATPLQPRPYDFGLTTLAWQLLRGNFDLTTFAWQRWPCNAGPATLAMQPGLATQRLDPCTPGRKTRAFLRKLAARINRRRLWRSDVAMPRSRLFRSAL